MSAREGDDEAQISCGSSLPRASCGAGEGEIREEGANMTIIASLPRQHVKKTTSCVCRYRAMGYNVVLSEARRTHSAAVSVFPAVEEV